MMKRLNVIWFLMLLGVGGFHRAQAQYASGFISGVTTTADSTYDATRIPANVTNNSGMTEGVSGLVGSKDATMSTAGGGIWMSPNTAVQHWAEFDLQSPQKIGEMWVWNFNMSTYSRRGFRKVNVQYKTIATDPWTTLGGDGHVYELAQAPGTAGATATNQVNDAGPIQFGGVTAQFVRIITINGTVNEANWNAINAEMFCGLSEVRFYATVLETAPYVNPATVNFGGVLPYNKVTSAPLVIGGVGGTGSVQLTSATFAPNSKVDFLVGPTMPVTFNAGFSTTYTLRFQATEVGLHQTTLTLKFTTSSGTLTKKIPVIAVAQDYARYWIPNVIATDNSHITEVRGAQRIVDNSGTYITTGTLESHIGTTTTLHNTDTNNTMWTSASTTDLSTIWLQFDLGKLYDLGEMWVWNQNHPSYTTRGIKECKILYKVNDGDGWTMLGSFILKQVPTNNAYTKATNLEPFGLPINFNGAKVRYVRLEVLSNWGGVGYVGCSEIRFYEAHHAERINPVHKWALFE